MKQLDLINQLQNLAQCELDQYIKAGQRVAIIDYPHHANAGDSYIWLGEIAYLEKIGAKIEYVCWHGSYDPDLVKKIIGQDGIILFHGGGNLGDRWPEPNKFRLQALRDFKGYKLLQFPQTVRFDHAENIAETASAIKEHGQYVLLVRDHKSLQFAQAHFECDIALSPDMAFFIGALNVNPAICDGFVLARTDIESAGEKAVSHLPLKDLPGQWLRDDWLASDWLETKLANQFCKLNARFNRSVLGRKLMIRLANVAAQKRLDRGVRLLSQGKVVLTDRLHAHILCLLLNKRHVVLDNDYGKISTFHQAWTSSSEVVQFVGSFSEAITAVSEK